MSIWNVVDYFGQKVMDKLESAAKSNFGLNGRTPRVGEVYWDQGEYVGDGAFVKIQHHPGCTYTEDDHVIIFSIRLEAGTGGDIIYSAELGRWQPPYDKEPISEDKRLRILEKIQKSNRGPFIDRGVLPYEHVPSIFPKRWIVWTQPPG